MHRLTKAVIALSLAGGLAACGLRGELERPDPIFSEPTAPDEQALVPVAVPVQLAEVAIPEGPQFNSLGGEIPEAAPATDVDEAAMSDVGPG